MPVRETLKYRLGPVEIRAEYNFDTLNEVNSSIRKG